MVGDKRVGSLHNPGEVAHAKLATVLQRVGDLKSCRVAHGSRACGKLLSLLHREPSLPQGLGSLQVEAQQVTTVVSHSNNITDI